MGRKRINPKQFYCLQCNKEILNVHGFKIIKFCSYICKGKYFSAHFKNELQKIAYKNIAGWNKGLKGFRLGPRFQMRGRIGSFLGKKHTLETKLKMRLLKLNKKRTDLSGQNHWKWKKSSPFYKTIKNSFEWKQWRYKVFERDNYTCQECFKQGRCLHPHHIKPFAQILSEFLQTYSQFSPIEDKETLVRLAITYKPFWDVNNGITLCEDCHKQTNTYGVNKKLCIKS